MAEMLVGGLLAGGAVAGESTADTPGTVQPGVVLPSQPAAETPAKSVVFSDRPISLPASAFRVGRMPTVDAELTPGGQAISGVAPSVYLIVSASALDDASVADFGELRAPLTAENSRSAARIVASSSPVLGTVRRQTEDVYTPTFDGTRETCSHAHYDVLVVSVLADDGISHQLRAMREDVSQRSVANSACARPHME